MRVEKWLWIILLCLLPMAAYAQPPDDALVQALYVKSGLEKQLKQFPLVVQAAFEQASQADENIRKLPKHIHSAVKASIQQAFSQASLKAVVLPVLTEKLTPQDINEVLDWLDSPLGKRCTQLEEAASAPETLAEMQQYAVEMQKSPPHPDRVHILQKLDAATKGTESNVAMALNTQFALALAIISTLPLERQISPEDISRQLESNRSHLEAMVRSQVLVYFLFTYQNLTEDEIQQYIDFAASPAGSRYHSVTTEALKKAVLGGSIRWGKDIGDTIKQMEKQSET